MPLYWTERTAQDEAEMLSALDDIRFYLERLADAERPETAIATLSSIRVRSALIGNRCNQILERIAYRLALRNADLEEGETKE